jgi:hypothetical protein
VPLASTAQLTNPHISDLVQRGQLLALAYNKSSAVLEAAVFSYKHWHGPLSLVLPWQPLGGGRPHLLRGLLSVAMVQNDENSTKLLVSDAAGTIALVDYSSSVPLLSFVGQVSGNQVFYGITARYIISDDHLHFHRLRLNF